MNTLGRILRVFTLVLLLVGGLEIPSATVSAVFLDTTADQVFGQPDFTSNLENNNGLNANSLNSPTGLWSGNNSNLYVVDTANHRVLEYDTPLTSDIIADRVFGQPDFTSNYANNGGISAGSLSNPLGVALDGTGNLYVADTANHRVLEYDVPLTGDTTADRVFGQPGFTSNAANNGGISANSLNYPSGVALDAAGNLYVADRDNNRVLEYDAPLMGDTTADRVFGQPDFTSNAGNNGGISAGSLYYPPSVALDAVGNLYVVDFYNHRVLEYDTPLTSDIIADRVFGQPDFTSNSINHGGVSAKSLFGPDGVVLDAAGNLYVVDKFNHRVLVYNAPLTGDATADRVFGQPDFTSNIANNGGVSAYSLNSPSDVALDSEDNLYVTDTANHRVLEYDGVQWKTFLPFTRR